MIRRGKHAAPRQESKELRRFGRAIPLALAFLLATSAMALADTISNNLDGTVDADLEVMNLTVGGATGSVTFRYIETNDDSKNGCNLTGSGSQLVVGVGSNNTGVATVSVSSLTFSGCGQTKLVTITPVSAGTATVSLTYTSVTTSQAGIDADDFNLAPAAFTVNVSAPAPSNTAPTVAVTGVTDGATYEFGTVPVAGCSVTDAEDGASTFAPTLGAISGTLAVYGLGSQTATCSHTDSGGLSGSASATYTIVDTGAPTITDLGPTTSPDGDNGWYLSAVTNGLRASDSGAGFVGQTNPYDFTVSSGSAEGSAVRIASGPVSDVAGNTASSIDSAPFKIDLSDPTNVSFVDGPAAGSSHYFGSVPAAPTCTAYDAVSGLASCDVTGYSSAVGMHTMTATATDYAGRKATATRSYTVLAWTFGGFYQPVDMDRLNTARAGSTIPLKFEVFAGASELTDTSIVKTFTQKVSCTENGATDPIEEYATGNTSLRYDMTGGQFIFNWKTPTTKGCYRVTLETQDGTKIKADFQLK